MTAKNSRQMRELLQETPPLSACRSPCRARRRRRAQAVLRITRPGENIGIPLRRIPLWPRIHVPRPRAAAGWRPSARVNDEVLEQIRKLEGDFNFVTYISLSCQNPEVVQSLNLMALINPKIRHETVDGSLFPGRSDPPADHGGADGDAQRPGVRARSHGAGADSCQVDVGAESRAGGEDRRQGGVR